MSTRSGTSTARIGALEEGYKNLGREIGGLREDFSAFARDMREETRAHSRTQWSPIIAGVAVIVAVIGGLITLGAQGPMNQLALHSDEMQELNDELDSFGQTIWTRDDARYTVDKLLKREDDMRSQLREEILDVRARLRSHIEDGHPHTTREQIVGLARRLDLLERKP